MQELFEEGYRLCTCRKTHKSGDDSFTENEIFYYKNNGQTFSVFRDFYNSLLIIAATRNYTYLPGDFNEHFVDTIEQRNQKIDEILND